MKNHIVWLFVAFIAFLAACSSNEAGGIRLHYTWVDSEGNDITPPDLTLLHAWGELTYAKETKTAGPAWLGDPDDTLRFENLPYGVGMTLELTMRAAEDPAHKEVAPEERPDNVAYYCTSQEFKLVRGKVTDVENGCVLQKGPALGNDGSEAPAMKLFYRRTAADAPVEITATANVTPLSEIEIHVDPRNADNIVAANDPAFTMGKQVFAIADLQKDAENKVILPAWDLNGGLFTEIETPQDGIRLVYVKLKQTIGFESPAANAKVVLDTTAPRVVSRSFLRDPAYAPATEEMEKNAPDTDELPDDDALPAEEVTKVYYLSAHDPLVQDATVTGTLTLFADEPVSDAAAFVRNVDTDEEFPLEDIGLSFSSGAQNEMTFSGPITNDPALDGTYEVLVRLSDVVGNADEDPVAVENLLLVLRNAAPAADSVAMGKVLYRRIPWGSDETGGTPRFSVVAEPGAVTGGDIAMAIVYRAEEAAPGNIIGTATVESDGSFTVSDMTGGDLPNIYLSPTNRSGVVMPPMLVAEVEWTATMGGKVPGSSFENPHTFLHTKLFSSTLTQDTDKTTEPDVAQNLKMLDSLLLPGPSEARWREFPLTDLKPEARSSHAIAYDAARGKVVLFGGITSSATTNDTWEWDGATGAWTDRTTVATKPPERAGHCMAYDAVRGKVVLFGGSRGHTLYQDIWEWDDATGTWIDRTPTGNKPATRHHHAMVFDPVRGKIVLFGGLNGSDRYQDLWEWDGATGAWTDRTPADSNPAARSDHNMVYDASRGKVVLFGGTSGSITYGDLWEWDGTAGTWTDRTPTTSPSLWPTARSYHAMTYDPVRDRVLLFGGDDGSLRQDIWEWNGETGAWADRTPAEHKPTARYVAAGAMTYDTVRGKAVMFGGYDGGAFRQDIWEWNGATGTWADRTPTGKKPQISTDHAMAFDTIGGSIMLFGGFNYATYNNEVWEWDGESITWNNRTPTTTPPSWPSARGYHAMISDTVHDTIVLFGGYDGGAFRQDIWTWDSKNNAWNDLTPTTTPPSWPTARRSHAMIFDTVRDKIILFGGNTASGILKLDIWEWDGATGEWIDRTPTGLMPTTVTGYAVAYDPVREKAVLFGGQDNEGFCNDTWEWDGTTGEWTDRTPATVPPIWPMERGDHTMLFDPARNRTILFGGYNYTSSFRDLWEWDGMTGEWTDRTPTGIKPTARHSHAMAYDLLRSRMVLFGGNDENDELYKDDTWEWNGGAEDRAGHLIAASFRSIGDYDEAPLINSVSAYFFAGGTGHPSGIETFGVELKVWDKGMWKTIDDHTISPDELENDPESGKLEWTTTDPQVISRLFFGDQRTLNFAVTPVAPNGTGTGTVVTDYAEVIVRYTISE
ncbi:MAG TPA: kelch repeat-containing protein [bacterium]|nr:kelch repeat-containing protein [bacterium]